MLKVRWSRGTCRLEVACLRGTTGSLCRSIPLEVGKQITHQHYRTVAWAYPDVLQTSYPDSSSYARLLCDPAKLGDLTFQITATSTTPCELPLREV